MLEARSRQAFDEQLPRAGIFVQLRAQLLVSEFKRLLHGGTINTISINITVAPIHGTAVVQNGKVVYSPAQGYAGVDAFQYSIQDNLGTTSNVATVSLSVQPPPVAANDKASLQEDQSATINVLANDTSDGGTIDTSSISIASAPAHGTAAVKNGEIVYAPTTGYSGTDTFAYSVKDNLGAPSNTAQVSVDVAAAPATGGGGSGGGGGGTMDVRDIAALAVLLLMNASSTRWRRSRRRVLVHFTPQGSLAPRGGEAPNS